LQAACGDRGFDRLRAVRVHHRPEPLRLRLAAGGLQLLVGHRLLAAVAYARGREDLDDVGAVLLQLPYFLANLVRRSAALVQLPDRRQHARPGQYAASDRVAQLDVVRLAWTLYRGEARHERDVRVFGAVENFFGRASRAVRETPVFAEMPAKVRVHVDHAGNDRRSSEIVGGRSRPVRLDGGDLRSSDHDRRVADHFAG